MMHRFQVILVRPTSLLSIEACAEKEKDVASIFPGESIASVKDLGGWINPSQEWLNTEEAAVYLGVDTSTIWDMVQSEFLPAAVNGRNKWTREELDRGYRMKMGTLASATKLTRRAA